MFAFVIPFDIKGIGASYKSYNFEKQNLECGLISTHYRILYFHLLILFSRFLTDDNINASCDNT